MVQLVKLPVTCWSASTTEWLPPSGGHHDLAGQSRNIHMNTQIFRHKNMQIYMHPNIHTHTNVYIHIHKEVHIKTYTNIYTQTHTCTNKCNTYSCSHKHTCTKTLYFTLPCTYNTKVQKHNHTCMCSQLRTHTDIHMHTLLGNNITFHETV